MRVMTSRDSHRTQSLLSYRDHDCESMQEADGTPIAGHTLADCDSIIGDRIDRIVSWQGKSAMEPFAGRPVRLRFVMKDADLYSLQIR